MPRVIRLFIVSLLAALALVAAGAARSIPDPPPSPVRWSLYFNYWYDYTGYDNAYETAAHCYWYGLSSCAQYIHGSASDFVPECNYRGYDRVHVHNAIINAAEAARAAYGDYGVVAHLSHPAFFTPTCEFAPYDRRSFE